MGFAVIVEGNNKLWRKIQTLKKKKKISQKNGKATKIKTDFLELVVGRVGI